MDAVKVKKIEASRELREFIRVPWAIYAGDPNWVPPLIADMKRKLDRRRHPFFEHGEADYFLAFRGREPVGRVAAIVDRAHNERHRDRTGFFGLFECRNDPEAARALVDAAAAWARDKGMETLRGPMNLSMNDECAFLLEGFDSPPVVMMPYNPPYYLELMDACGMSKAKDLYAFRMDRGHETSRKVQAILARIPDQGRCRIRPFDKSRLNEEAAAIAGIYNSGWRNNWGFVPWTDAEIKHMAKSLVRFADPDIVLFAEMDGRPVGFAFGLPNLNEALAKVNGRLFPFGFLKILAARKTIKGVRAPVFGVVPEVMGTGLAYLLYDRFEKALLAKGFEWGELSWQLEDNEAINRFAASIGAGIYKKYRIYEKKIGTGGA